MGKVQEAEQIIAELSPAERAQLLRDLIQGRGESFPGIESTPGVCGGDPCIVRTRIPVWMLELSRRMGVSDSDLLISYPSLRAQDLANAWAFVELHRAEIDRQIEENESA